MNQQKWRFLACRKSLIHHYFHRCCSKTAALDREIYSFLINEAAESIPKQCSEMRKLNTIEVISNLLRPVTNEAGVLVPICIVDKRPSLLYTVRGKNLKSHRGEISFPGGKKDSTDKTITDAALREAEEEISLKRESIRVFHSFGPFTSRKLSVSITAVFAFTGEIDLSKLVYNHDEVDEVFTVPIADLANDERARYTQFRNGWCMPVFLSKPHNIWGITANITDALLSMINPLNYKQKFFFQGRGYQNSHVANRIQT